MFCCNFHWFGLEQKQGGHQPPGTSVSSLTWERYHCPLWHHECQISITACLSPHFLKSEASNGSRGWSFLISGQSVDRLETCIILRKHLYSEFCCSNCGNFNVVYFKMPWRTTASCLDADSVLWHLARIEQASSLNTCLSVMIITTVLNDFMSLVNFP